MGNVVDRPLNLQKVKQAARRYGWHAPLRVDPNTWWNYATKAERDALAHVYVRLRVIPTDLREEVRFAEIIAVLEDYDYRTWPDHYQLSGVIDGLQQVVTLYFENHAVDCVQRANYFILARGGQGRHNDVAYGLSGKLLWSDKERVVDSLLAMGRREYSEPIPSSHEAEDGVLHVAVSYKHQSPFNQGGTINQRQAEGVWMAVRCLPNVNERTTVRVWVDQNLHRKKFPEGREWHEYGLLPYACLQTVYVGDGDFSLRYAHSRPWVWVEMLTGLKASGLHTRQGYDPLQDCANVLLKKERWDAMRTHFLKSGCVFGPAKNVDQVMGEVTRSISLWRRNGFLGHTTYEYADDFEKFVNWARRFVIRGKKYSEMAWNHSSEDVRGMDAIVLLRSMSTSNWYSESAEGAVTPNISWKCSPTPGWKVEDLVDRTLVGELPMSTIIGTIETRMASIEDLTLMNKTSQAPMGLKFRKAGDTVHIVLDEKEAQQAATRMSPAYQAYQRMVQDLSRGREFVTMTVPESLGHVITYQPFTQRFGLGYGYARVSMQDEVLQPMQVDANIWHQLDLQVLGVAYNSGLCEQVYEVNIEQERVPVSALEVYMVMGACNGDVKRFKEILKALKEYCSYKSIGYKDFSPVKRLKLTRGWPVSDLKDLKNQRIASGEMEFDIDEELAEAMRNQHPAHAFVWVDEFDAQRTQITFRGKSNIVRFVTRRLATGRALAIVEADAEGGLVNAAQTGPLQMVAGVQPLCRVKKYGAGLNPYLPNYFEYDGWELNINMVHGLFASCAKCGLVVCIVNGLVAEVTQTEGLYYIVWKEPHACLVPEYSFLEVDKRVRVV